MAQKKKKSLSGWILGAVIVVAYLADASAGVWVLIGLATAYLVYRWNKLSAAADSDVASATNTYAKSIKRQASDLPIRANRSEQSGYRIPAPPKEFAGAASWLPLGETVEIAGFNITGGLLYVGSRLQATHGMTEPALIDPSKSVSRTGGNFTERLTNYWPSYSDISPEARCAYLRWLSEGRNHPEAEIGYVFLYFYGLERRALVNTTKENMAEADRPHILAELKRLLAIYGEKSSSFRNYATNLRQFLELTASPAKLYEEPVPDLPESFELPFHLRLALGQAAVDGVPIPSNIALAWAEHDQGISRRTAINRCKGEFRQLFKVKYQQLYGDGIKLSVNRTKLKLTYRPASAGFRGAGEVNLRFGDVPDVTALTGPIKKLQAVVDTCAAELEAYSRFVGRNPDNREALEGVLQLPALLWPESPRKVLEALKARVAESMVVMTFDDLAGAFKSTGGLTREKIQGLARALESAQICIEPDVLAGAKSPKPGDNVVLFHSEAISLESRAAPGYLAAMVTLELAACVAAADGDFSAPELRYLNAQIESWLQFSVPIQKRLKARVRLLMVAPVSLASLKKKIEPLSSTTREAVASFSATLVQADGTVSPDEVKLLEKIYKLLGVDSKRVYSDVHLAATSKISSITIPSASVVGLTLDTARIAALQQDTEKVSELLSNIFNEEAYPALQSQPDEPEELNTENRILSLDESHSAFARVLISRPSWLRDELNDVALDLDVMLDGALERVNEAALDTLDMAFTDGDDPVEINPEIIEKLTQ
ncbi:TerB N-terminal domain-containing protein [Collimonas fungivorans]|uniref:tellurite resistance TerB family protein n=1 Tax=Collimonas fungivorans TaxID=158899 RepID=UPI003FA34603